MNWFRDGIPPNGDIGLVITGLSAKYIRPLRVADEIVVESHIAEPGAVSIKVEHKFTKDGETHAVIQIKIAYLGADARPKRIPAEWLKHF
jgi:acyl-CoA thioester hydrolase